MRTEKRALEVEESLVLKLFTHKALTTWDFSPAPSRLFVGCEARGDKALQGQPHSVVNST